jgi:hypothetical protein
MPIDTAKLIITPEKVAKIVIIHAVGAASP